MSIWQDAMASLSGDAAAQDRIGTVAKNASSAYDTLRSLIGDGQPKISAPSTSAATLDEGGGGLVPSGFSMAQIGVGLSAAAVVLWLALRRR